MKPVRQWAALAALSASLWTTPLFAVDHTPPLPDPVMQQRYLDLTHELRCVQCQNEALADSNVNVAADLRLEIHDMLLAGKSDEEIRDYLVARYSEFILFRPRMNWHNAWLWGAPGLMLLAGFGIAIRVMRKRASLPITDDDEPGSTPAA
ncbi:MAG TPA: cytochrome c-type biogenesis protein [Steroidobacteraceae bacterium]